MGPGSSIAAAAAADFFGGATGPRGGAGRCHRHCCRRRYRRRRRRRRGRWAPVVAAAFATDPDSSNAGACESAQDPASSAGVPSCSAQFHLWTVAGQSCSCAELLAAALPETSAEAAGSRQRAGFQVPRAASPATTASTGAAAPENPRSGRWNWKPRPRSVARDRADKVAGPSIQLCSSVQSRAEGVFAAPKDRALNSRHPSLSRRAAP
mmetsp:Transcript_24750/g.62966  ORF Transcript_24750/g.62966 Transcript_24750/m.62966 type:complete len:209 (-) Transcript_24750:379-1005(-)